MYYAEERNEELEEQVEDFEKMFDDIPVLKSFLENPKHSNLHDRQKLNDILENFDNVVVP